MTSTDRRYGVAEGLPYKAPCRVATTANIVLSGLQTINGVVTVADDRVLVKDQADTTENGIYSAASTGWSRTVDADGARDLVSGTQIYVVSGTTSAQVTYAISAANPIIIGTSNITLVALSPFVLGASVTQFDAVADSSTAVDAEINNTVAFKTANGGGMVNVPANSNFYMIDNPITLADGTCLRGEGHTSTAVKLKDNSDCDLIQTEDFASLTGTGVSLVSAGVKHGFSITGLRLDGNKANQSVGYGIAIYGKRYLIDDVIITNVKEVGFYAEVGNDGADTSTTWADMPEAIIRYLSIDSSGGHNFVYRGRTDPHITALFSRLAGGRGASFEANGAVFNGLADVTFAHIYANALEGVYAGVRVKFAHLESESNYRTGLHLDTGASHSSFGILELFGNDIADTSTYWNGLIEAAYVVINGHQVLDNRVSAGGLKITGASTRVGMGSVRQTGNTNATAIGVEIDGEQIGYEGKITGYSTAGQTGLRTSQTAGRSYLTIDATIEGCYTGWNNVTASLGGSFKLRINAANKDHLLFTGAGPGTFDLSAGGGIRDREQWDVIAVNTGTSHTGTATAGAAGTLTLAATASTRDDVYIGCILTTTGGTGSGQVRVVSDYVGSTKVASVTPNWTVTPDNTTTYSCATLTLGTNTEGTGTIPNGSTSVTIPHGMLITAMTPTARNILISSTNSLGSASRLHISAVDKHTFTVTANTDPGATTATFAWRASLTP